MSSYLVDFIAYVDERKRPENFPHSIHHQKVFNRVENTMHLQYLVNEEFIKLVTSAGLISLINPDEPLEEGKVTFDKRMFIPWHMVTHMRMDVHHIAEQSVSPQTIISQTEPEPEPKSETIN